MSKNHRAAAASPKYTLAHREADERMVNLLAEMQSARDAYVPTWREYVRCLRAWAAFVQTDAENSIGLGDAFTAAHGLEDVSDRQLSTIMGRTETARSADPVWSNMVDACFAYYRARLAYDNAKGKAIAYYQYCHENQTDDRDLPQLIAAAIDAAIEEHGEPPTILNR